MVHKLLTILVVCAGTLSIHSLNSMKRPYYTHQYTQGLEIVCKVSPCDNSRLFAQRLNPQSTNDLNEQAYRAYSEKEGKIAILKDPQACLNLFWKLKSEYNNQQILNSKL